MYLTSEQRRALRDASTEGIEAIKRVIVHLQQANPQAFHDQSSLACRLFHHEPGSSVPNSGFVDSIASGRTAQAMNGSKHDRT